jgi:hypothetical protein
MNYTLLKETRTLEHLMKRFIEFDVLRGILLLMMVVNHSPSSLRLFTDEPLGRYQRASSGRSYGSAARDCDGGGFLRLCRLPALLTDKLHFKRVEFWIRQAAEQIDAMGKLRCNLKEEMPHLFRRAPETKRIRRMPVGNDGLTWPSRSHFFSLIANGNDEIKILALELFPGLAPGITRIDPEILPEDLQCHRMYSAGGIRTGAVNLETATSPLAKKVLSENASRRITVAKNKDTVGRVGVHQREQPEAKAFFTVGQKKLR